jgi:hypothetical protein
VKPESIAAAVIMLLLIIGLTIAAGLGYRYSSASSRAETAESQVTLQARVIQIQADNIAAFQTISGDVQEKQGSRCRYRGKTIEYRTILKREKTCDMPVPADVSGGLLEYTNSLRSSAVHAYTDGSDKPSTGTITAGELTYCQAVLWITPLLAAIEKANNQLAGIRQIEQKRQETK